MQEVTTVGTKKTCSDRKYQQKCQPINPPGWKVNLDETVSNYLEALENKIFQDKGSLEASCLINILIFVRPISPSIQA